MAATTTKAQTSSAAVHNITPPIPTRDEKRIALGKLAEDWEGDICDTANMVDVCLTVFEATTSSTSAVASGFPDMHLLTKEQINQIAFVLYQANRMAITFKEKYYAAVFAE
jgi:hypothetical protein